MPSRSRNDASICQSSPAMKVWGGCSVLIFLSCVRPRSSPQSQPGKCDLLHTEVAAEVAPAATKSLNGMQTPDIAAIENRLTALRRGGRGREQTLAGRLSRCVDDAFRRASHVHPDRWGFRHGALPPE